MNPIDRLARAASRLVAIVGWGFLALVVFALSGEVDSLLDVWHLVLAISFIFILPGLVLGGLVWLLLRDW